MDEALWHSWTYVSDIGNLAETEGMVQRIVSVLISADGMLLGFLSDAISENVDSLRKGKNEVIERHLVLILGWSDKSGSLLKQLAKKSVGDGVIVVVPTQTLDKEQGILVLNNAITCCTVSIEKHPGG